ncbi:MAG: MATE family efflux transporter [Oscillospiraceae bacterium]|nr:MATE family efflux transporter [Oscillospiraceae bacterium]
MANTLNMTRGKPMGLLFSFALPLMFGNMFQQLYTVVDTAIVGQGVGIDALAALGAVDWLNWLFVGLAQGFCQGFCVRISQKFGEGDLPGLRRITGQSAFLCILIALVGTALGQLLLPVFLWALRVPAQLQDMAALYVRILLAGFPAVMFFNYCSSVLRAIGNSKTPLYAMIAASVTNIVLDAVAVFWLHWGIAGAAVATVFSQCLSGVICALKIRKTQQLHFTKEDLCPQGVLCRNLLAIGTPAAAKNIIIALGGMMVQSIVNGFTLSFIAGFTATNKLYGLLEIAATSYGYAVTTYVGQNFGAGKHKRIKEGMTSAVLLSLITSAVIAAIMLVFGRPITMVFISREDPVLAAAAGDIAYWYLCAMAVSLPVLYLLYVFQSGLQGLGNTLSTMVSGIIEFCLRVSLSIAVGFSGFQYGIFGAEVAAWWGAAIFLILSFVRNFKKVQTHS